MMVALQRLWIQLTADRRRFGILCATLCVGLLLWARIIVISKPPRTAIADPNMNAATPENMQDSGAGLLADNRPRPTREVTLDQSPMRNPFAISERYFPRPAQIDQFPGEDGKSEEHHAENPVEAEQRRLAHWRAIIGSLSLDAVMSNSDQPMAVINGRMLRVGEQIQPGDDPSLVFELVEVAERSVILSRDGHRLELKMAPPGGR